MTHEAKRCPILEAFNKILKTSGIFCSNCRLYYDEYGQEGCIFEMIKKDTHFLSALLSRKIQEMEKRIDTLLERLKELEK